jgi:hypothetical protein
LNPVPIAIPSLEDFYGILDTAGSENKLQPSKDSSFDLHKKQRAISLVKISENGKTEVRNNDENENKAMNNARVDVMPRAAKALARSDTKEVPSAGDKQQIKRKHNTHANRTVQQLNAPSRLIGTKQTIQNQILKELSEVKIVNGGRNVPLNRTTLMNENLSCKRVFLVDIENEDLPGQG